MRTMFVIAVLALTLGMSAGEAQAEPQFSPAIKTQGGYVPPKPKEGFRYPDCFCTDSEGQRIELGRMTCLQVGSQQFMARCAMSLNNPTWRRVSDGCPSV
jgi:hypothetical protein